MANPYASAAKTSSEALCSQRHPVLHDQITHAEDTLGNFGIFGVAYYTTVNSPLSEFSVLGFDYGYSIAARDSLVLWEAQFGELTNNAGQVYASLHKYGEAKDIKDVAVARVE
ncbi:oxoglutarate dehydrogenase [Colletotrichum orchidophilum]|uniref:Oxoglutarate dehydrogenase n=1 Tax=Colletotrichum orchidophilum TaxID=1209926 RepID=A0A1G4B0H5_9PEZI|nr:oxoglutarate dehydrogenase [Colletotrichum orchidophilum]OHE94887.1 oxoglutarate dehydrogenase [Colletotrichum orchidophilum]